MILPKKNLEDAIEAIDDLKKESESNKKALQDINLALSSAEDEKSNKVKELAELRKMIELDSELAKGMFGIPSIRELRVQRTVGFVLGVLGSLLASLIWYLVSNYFPNT